MSEEGEAKKFLGWENPFGPKGYVNRLASEFGIRYVIMVVVIYGMNQAISLTWGYFARDTYFSDAVDKNGLGYTPAKSASVIALAGIPWQIKALYGIFSDAFAIRGKHRTPYIIGSAFLGATGWAFLGIIKSPPEFVVIMLLFFTNLAVACPDVMIDATVAERCQRYPEYAVDLQSLCWGGFAIGAVVANLSGGPLYEAFEASRPVFLITATIPICVLVPTCLGWIKEEKDMEPWVSRERFFKTFTRIFQKDNTATVDIVATNPEVDQEEKGGAVAAFTDDELEKTNSKIYMLALILCAISIAIGTIINAYDGNLVKGICYGISVFLVCSSLYYFQRGIHMDLVRVSIYIFIKGAMQPNSRVLFFWYRDTEENCSEEQIAKYDRPCMSESYISQINVLGNVFMLIGTIIYNRFLSKMSYRKIWIITQFCILMVTFIDYIWVQGWHRTLGIPDEVMLAVGDEVLLELMDRFESMPFFILAAKLCPEGLEATLFATMMGLSNFGRDMGSYMGSILLNVLDVTQESEFNNLDTFILIRNFTRVAVILIIPFLVPPGSPMDPSIYENSNWANKAGDDEDEDDVKAKRASLEARVQIEGARRGSIHQKLN